MCREYGLGKNLVFGHLLQFQNLEINCDLFVKRHEINFQIFENHSSFTFA